jgi:hypothetical protein
MYVTQKDDTTHPTISRSSPCLASASALRSKCQDKIWVDDNSKRVPKLALNIPDLGYAVFDKELFRI